MLFVVGIIIGVIGFATESDELKLIAYICISISFFVPLIVLSINHFMHLMYLQF